MNQQCGVKPGADLVDLLVKHAGQAAALADRLATAEGVLLDLVENNLIDKPLVALDLLHGFERARRSTARDFREAVVTLRGLRATPAPVQIAVVQPAAEVTIKPVASRQPRRLQRG